MIDHISIRVGDFEKSKKFYTALLKTLGYEIFREEEGKTAFRTQDGSGIWLRKDNFVSQGCHFAFRAPNKESVDQFHAVGLAAGGRDNGVPGTRPHRGDQYIAFILDPDGNNIEAVFHPSS